VALLLLILFIVPIPSFQWFLRNAFTVH
jgi:hypothetical protein